MSDEKEKAREASEQSPAPSSGGILRPRSNRGRNAAAPSAAASAVASAVVSAVASTVALAAPKEAPSTTCAPKSRTRSRYETRRAHVAWTDILQQAREFYTGDKPIASVDRFFEERGFSIKIAHATEQTETSDTSSSPEAICVPSPPCSPPRGEHPGTGAKPVSGAPTGAPKKITQGLFVINDEDTPTSGIVVDALDNFKILVKPLPDVVRNENVLKFCLANIEDYEVYRAVDGTRVSLYYVERLKTWLMATAHSYDARDYKWIGQKTYMEAFMECARAYINPEFSLDSLDKGAVYALIFRHHNFHPLVRDPQGIWQISGPRIAGARQYVPMAREEVPSVDTLRFLARKSFVEYAQTGDANYGYIFRKRTAPSATLDESDMGGIPPAVYLESSLHEFVRQQMYDIPSTVANLTCETRPIYLHLRGYMSLGSNHAHLLMFPRAGDIYTKMDFVISLLTDLTVAEMRASNKADAKGSVRSLTYVVSPEQAKIGETLFGAAKWQWVRNFIMDISKCVGSRLLSAGAMGAFGDHIHSNVHDQYLNITNMPEFMRILSASDAKIAK